LIEKVQLNETTELHSNLDLKRLIRFDEDAGCIWLGQQRMVLLHASALGQMRSELVKSVGEDYTTGLLMRLGYKSGHSDAQTSKTLRPDGSLLDMFIVGPQLHAIEGVVSVAPIKLEIDIQKGHFYGEFVWKNSFEAYEHLRLFGISEQPVCWHLLGYASGYTSEFMGKPILYKEIECVGKGDKQCRIVGKPLSEWGVEEKNHKLFSESKPIAEVMYTLKDEVTQLRSKLEDNVQPSEIIGESPNVKEAIKLLQTAANCDVTVMMLGETGVGKEVFSQVLHRLSKRADKPFVAVNCATLPEDLIEAELFGVEKGAYTGAEKTREGRFERADGGTLFLDELGELSARAQSKLLRVLQSGEFDPVGSVKTKKVDVRIVVATNEDLQESVKQGKFRADLLYRLNVFPVTIPPLKDRLDDLLGLVEKFIKRNNTKYGKKITGISDLAMEWFTNYDWPGNIRELENVIERSILLTPNHQQIETKNLMGQFVPAQDSNLSRVDRKGELVDVDSSNSNPISELINKGVSLDELEVEYLKEALTIANGNVSAAARAAKMPDAKFRYRLKKHNINV